AMSPPGLSITLAVQRCRFRRPEAPVNRAPTAATPPNGRLLDWPPDGSDSRRGEPVIRSGLPEAPGPGAPASRGAVKPAVVRAKTMLRRAAERRPRRLSALIHPPLAASPAACVAACLTDRDAYRVMSGPVVCRDDA